MKLQSWTFEKAVAAGLGAAILCGAAAFLIAVLRRGPEPSGGSRASGGRDADPYRRAVEMRKELVEHLLSALAEASRMDNRPRLLEVAREIERLGDTAVPSILARLRGPVDWNLGAELVAVLGRIRTGAAAAALAELYRTLKPVEGARKSLVVAALSRTGIREARQALLELLSAESDPEARGAIGKALVQLGLRPDDLARLSARDRGFLGPEVSAREGQRTRLETLDALDPASESDFGRIREAALEETTVALALVAFRKLEERDDEKSAEILAERVRRTAESPEDKIAQTNALASLSRMKSSRARTTVRELVLSGQLDLRRQAVALVGAFGDEAMLPLLHQAAVAADPQLKKVTEDAIFALRSRISRH